MSRLTSNQRARFAEQAGKKPHRSNTSDAAVLRQMRRRLRNKHKATIEKQFTHDKESGITSFALIVTPAEA